MSEQQFYETVQREEEFRDSWVKQYLEVSGDDLYCSYCMTPKGEKFGCCQEAEFVPLNQLSLEDQMSIISDEYDLAYNRAMKK